MKLCQPCVLAGNPSQGHEMLFEAPSRSFAAFGGEPRPGIYHNMETVVNKVDKGKTVSSTPVSPYGSGKLWFPNT